MWRQNSQIQSTFACSHPHVWPSWFPDRTVHAWKGNVWSVSVSFIRVSGHISPCPAKKDSNITTPRRTRSGKCPTGTQGPTPTPCHAPPPPAGFTLIGVLRDRRSKPAWLNYKRQKVQTCVRSDFVLCIPFILSGSPSEAGYIWVMHA